MRGTDVLVSMTGKAKGRINVIGACQSTALRLAYLKHINSDVFHDWVTQDLLNKLQKMQWLIMIMRLFIKQIHKGIQDAGFIPEYLPSYSLT